jgi:ribonuclease Z
MYHEATFMDSEQQKAEETLHATASQAGAIAKAAEAKQLILGHFSQRYRDLQPLLAEARAVFPHTRLAEEGETLVLK